MFEEEHDFPGCGFFVFFENLDFWTFDHCILYSFLPGFSLCQRGIVSTKQMMVYEQITCFIKNRNFTKFIFDRKAKFVIKNLFFDPRKTPKTTGGGGDHTMWGGDPRATPYHIYLMCFYCFFYLQSSGRITPQFVHVM